MVYLSAVEILMAGVAEKCTSSVSLSPSLSFLLLPRPGKLMAAKSLEANEGNL